MCLANECCLSHAWQGLLLKILYATKNFHKTGMETNEFLWAANQAVVYVLT